MTGGQVFLAVIVLAALGGGGAVLADRMPSCENRDVMRDVVDKLRHDQGVDGFMVAGIKTLHGTLFGQRSCRVLVRELRGNVDLTTHPWTEVDYSDPPSNPIYKIVGTAMPPIMKD